MTQSLSKLTPWMLVHSVTWSVVLWAWMALVDYSPNPWLHCHKGSCGRGEGLNEDQVALVVPDPTEFSSQVQVILGTSTINQIINVIKESEIDELSVSLHGLRISYLLACHQINLSIDRETALNRTRDLTDLNEAVKMKEEEEKKKQMLFLQGSYIHTWTKTMFLGSNMHVMMQTLEKWGGPYLPHEQSVINTYTKMTAGSKWVAVVVKNLTALQSPSLKESRSLEW